MEDLRKIDSLIVSANYRAQNLWWLVRFGKEDDSKCCLRGAGGPVSGKVSAILDTWQQPMAG